MATSSIQSLINEGVFEFRRAPFSVSIVYFREGFQRALAESFRPLLIAGLFLLVGVTSALLIPGRYSLLVIVSWILVALSFLCLIAPLPYITARWRALNYTSFLVLHQHDRALAGLCDALAKGRSILLYLRDFKDEEDDELYFQLENKIISIIGESQVLLAISNPGADPTLKISPIPRLLTPNAKWKDVVAQLIGRSSKIIIAARDVRSGLAWEIDEILRSGGASKTVLVNMDPEGQEALLPGRSEFPQQVSVRDFWLGIFNPTIFSWLGDHAFFTFKSEERIPVKFRYQSNRLRFWWARLSLLGWKSLIPRTRFGFYRKWLGAFDEFDPLAEVRERILSAEQRAAQLGQTVLPLDIFFKVEEGQNPGLEKWNQNKIQMRRMETAVFVLSIRASWIPIRRALRRTY